MIFEFSRFSRFWVGSAILCFLGATMGGEAQAIHGFGGLAPVVGGCASGNCGGDPTFCKLSVPGYPAPFATPHPTVPTHLTYGPFMPHNSLPNYRGTYVIPHANGGPGGTQVHWRAPKGINTLKRIHHAFEWAR